jgi:hypothetical protein
MLAVFIFKNFQIKVRRFFLFFVPPKSRKTLFRDNHDCEKVTICFFRKIITFALFFSSLEKQIVDIQLFMPSI